MSLGIMQLVTRQPTHSRRNEILLIDELSDDEIVRREQRIKSSQTGIEIALNRHAAYLKKQAERARIYYQKKPELKEIKRLRSAIFRNKNPKRAAELSKSWRDRNPEAVKRFQHEKYLRRKATMTPEQFKAWQREKNAAAKARKIALIGIEAYRSSERERVKKHYANNPDTLKRNREKNKESMRLRRQKEKELKNEVK
jgi:hypothetical protein